MSTSKASIHKELYLTLKRVYDALTKDHFKLCKEFGITASQYDMLETISHSESGALSIQKLAENMISFQPNITRLAEALEKQGLVSRMKDMKDRRVVWVKLTNAGSSLLGEINPALNEMHEIHFSHFSKPELTQTLALLSKMVGQKEVRDFEKTLNS